MDAIARRRSAFTLIELLVVVAIIAILIGDDARKAALIQAVGLPTPLINCPSRRTGGPYTNGQNRIYRGDFAGTVTPPQLARTDYAACAGSQPRDEIDRGPDSIAQADA